MICTCPTCQLNEAEQNSQPYPTLFQFAVGWSLPNDDLYAKPPYNLPREFYCPLISRASNCPNAIDWCHKHFAINISGFPLNTPWMRTDPLAVVPAPKHQPKIELGGRTSPPDAVLPQPTALPNRRRGPNGQYTIFIHIAEGAVKPKKHLTAEQWKNRMNKSDENKIRAKAGTLWQDDKIVQDKIAAAKEKRAAAAEQRVADIKARTA